MESVQTQDASCQHFADDQPENKRHVVNLDFNFSGDRETNDV